MSPFIESIRVVIRTKQYSLKTEKSYLYWDRYFIRLHQLKHLNEMGAAFVCANLGYELQTLQHASYLQSWIKVFKKIKKLFS